jgi:hypothetical protein
MSSHKSGGAEVWPAVNLTRDTRGMCVVSLRVGGRWVPVIRDNGDVISHFCEPGGIAAAVESQAGACDQPRPEVRVAPVGAWFSVVVIAWVPVVAWTKWMGWW